MSRPRREEYRLWQHPNGTYYILWTGPGGSRRLSTRAKNRRSAERFLAQFKAGALSRQAPQAPTVAEILDGYLEDKKGQARSWATLDYSCRPLRKAIGDLEPAHLNRAVLRGYAKERTLAGRKPSTIIREIVTLRAALKWALSEKWISSIPELPMPVSAPPPRDRWLSRDEARKLVAACASPHIKLFVLLALKTAARKGAIIDLRWSAVDMERRLIDFGQGHGNKRRSIVPIDDQLLEALREAKELACTPYVIEHNGRRVHSIKTAFRAAARRAGLTGISPHTLRHTAATWAVMEGVPLAEVARLLGDTEKMIEKVYGKHSPDYLRRAVGALAL